MVQKEKVGAVDETIFTLRSVREANMGRDDKERFLYPLMVQSLNYK